MKKQLLDLLHRGDQVDIWADIDARPQERYVVQVWAQSGLRNAVNYYGRTLTLAIKRAWEDQMHGEEA